MAELPPSAFEDQENAKTTNLIKRNHTKIDENIPLEIGGKLLGAIGTPKAASTKSLQTNRRVLAEKTPNNVKKPLQSGSSSKNIVTSPTKSPSLLNNLTTTPLEHPSFKDIAAANKSLDNPPDLFLQPPQKRRSFRHQTISNKESLPLDSTKGDSKVDQNKNEVTSKLISVFPTTSDDLDSDEIEHAASSLVDEDSLNLLSGPSTIIPNLELHENIDFSALINDFDCVATTSDTTPTTTSIEPILIDFKEQQNM